MLERLEGHRHRLHGLAAESEDVVRQRVGFLARRSPANDRLRQASKILDEHNPQGDRDRPERYTGSAGWMYRAGLEWILGFRLRGTRLVVDPCIPRAWQGFKIAFRYRSARYDI